MLTVTWQQPKCGYSVGTRLENVCFELGPSRLWQFSKYFLTADSLSLCLLPLGAVASFYYF